MTLLGPLLTLLVCAYALRLGGPCERAAAGLGLVALAGSLAAQAVAGCTPWKVIGADLVIAVGLLVLAVRYGRPWTLAAITLTAALLLVHSLLLEDGAKVTPLYRGLVDGFNLGLLATLASGVALADRARRRALTAS